MNDLNQKYNLPQDWILTSIGKIAKVKGGKRLPLGHQFSEAKTPYPYIRVVDFYRNSVNTEKLEYLLEKTQKAISPYVISANDIYISIAGTIGLVGIIPKHLEGANLTENAAKITEINISMDKDYLMYYLDSEVTKHQIRKLVGITTQPKLALERIEKIEVIKPSKAEQINIASILIKIDSALNESDRVINKYKNIKQGLMQDLFNFGIDENGQIRSEETHTFKDSSLGKIPDTWATIKLGDKQFVHLITDGSHFSPTEVQNSNYLIATVENMEENQIDMDSCKNISEIDFKNLVRNNCRPEKRDVLFSKDGTIGKVLIYNQSDNVVILSSISIIRTKKDKLLPDYLAHFLKSYYLSKQLLLLTSGSALRRIVLRDINNIVVKIPPLSEQTKIVNMLNNIDKVLRAELLDKDKLISIKVGLMDDLLTGKVRVNQLLN